MIPAYCEAENILPTLDNVTGALRAVGVEHEVLVIDDGSSDGTADLLRAHAGRYPRMRVLVNDRNRGFGWSYRRGVDAAILDNIVMVHGDNAWGRETLQDFFGRVGDADVVIGFTRHMFRSRTWTRACVSKAFTAMLNLITGRRLHYYNGLQIHPAGVLKALQIESAGYGFQAEVLVKSLRRTRTFVEVPMDLTERTRGESKAFRVRNVVDVARTLRRLCALEWTAPRDAAAVPAEHR